MAKLAERVYCFEEGPRDSPKLTAKKWQKMKDQRMLEAFTDQIIEENIIIIVI